MAWTAPRDWTVGETVTEDMMDEQVKGNLRYLKGLDGLPTIESGLIIDNTDGDEYILPPLLSTAECASVLDAEGKIAFDETTHQLKEYDGTAVRVLISEADVDDTPVNGATTVPVSSNWAFDLKAMLTTRGDSIRRGAADWERLALGTSGQYLSSNGTDVVWAAGTLTAGIVVEWDGSIATIPSGYVICDGNNGTVNRLGRFPKQVDSAATEPGTTGGSTAKNVPASAATAQFGDNAANVSPTSHTHTIADIRPLYIDTLYIMKT